MTPNNDTYCFTFQVTRPTIDAAAGLDAAGLDAAGVDAAGIDAAGIDAAGIDVAVDKENRASEIALSTVIEKKTWFGTTIIAFQL